MLHEPVWRPKSLDAAHESDVMDWGHSYHDQPHSCGTTSKQKYTAILSAKAWGPTVTNHHHYRDFVYNPAPSASAFLHIHKCCQVWSQGSNSLTVVWEVTVAAALRLLCGQIAWMLLVPDKKHPGWFLTDRTAGNRKMANPAQGSLIHRTLVTRQDIKACILYVTFFLLIE